MRKRLSQTFLLGLGTLALIVAGWSQTLLARVLWAAAAVVCVVAAPFLELDGSRPREAGAEPAEVSAEAHSGVSQTSRSKKNPRQLPEPGHVFIGRDKDLKDLQGQFRSQAGPLRNPLLRRGISKRRRKETNNPVLLFIHGQPGVGKSALAGNLAHSIARYFPDGVLRENLGSVGSARDPGEILGSLLDTLGHPMSSLGTDERRDRFRSVTGPGRYLIILEAAHSADQVRQLLPNGLRCAVIVTSRCDISRDFDVPSHWLQVPGPRDAARMLCAYMREDTDAHAQDVAEIVELCGRLPLALESAGVQIVHRRYDVAGMAEHLRPESTRLGRLSYGALLPHERIESEYKRLGEQERCAFRRLALLQSTTFLPWVFAPLLEVDLSEAENIVTKLEEAQLVERVHEDNPLGIVRYSAPPLSLAFARSRLQVEDSPVERDRAHHTLDLAYLDTVTAILTRLEPDLCKVLTRTLTLQPGMANPPSWLRGFVKVPRHWVRAEYGNLLRSIIVAHQNREWALCWRVAAKLENCVPMDLDPQLCFKAFELAQDAAGQDRDDAPCGLVEVLLAKGAFLAAVEFYPEAFKAFDDAYDMTRQLEREYPELGLVSTLKAAVRREIGAAWLQLGCYERARNAFTLAEADVLDAGDQAEQRRIEVLKAVCESAIRPEYWLDSRRLDAIRADGSSLYDTLLGRSEAARRNRQWQEAESLLLQALSPSYGDARRRAAIEYRLARLRLSERRATTDESVRDRCASEAVGHAATALLRFQRMDNQVGVIRARCILARAFVAADRPNEADYNSRLALSEIDDLADGASSEDFLAALRARANRARGETLLCQGRVPDAIAALTVSEGLFRELGDWWSYAEALLFLGRAQGSVGLFEYANASLHMACARFAEGGDIMGTVEATAEIGLIASRQGRAATVRECGREVRRLRRTTP